MTHTQSFYFNKMIYMMVNHKLIRGSCPFQSEIDSYLEERVRNYGHLFKLFTCMIVVQVVSSGMRTKCTCHGVSGSCSVRTCWRSLPPLARVAAALAGEAARAGPLRPHARHARRARPRLRYVTPSPDYCEPDPAAGSLGTHGR